MDVSVIVVNWNTKGLLLDCLRSVNPYGGKRRVEIIVVDNGSSDGSADAVRAEFPGVKLIETGENLGFARANNIGIRESKGRYVCLVNSDVRILDDCLERLAEYMDRNPTVGIVGPRILWPDLSMQDSCRNFPSLWNNFCPVIGLDRVFKGYKLFSGEHMFCFAHDQEAEVDFLAGCFLMIRREGLDQVGLFDERFFIYSEEIDLCKRFWKSGWKVMFFPGAQAIHNARSSSSKAPLRFHLEQQRSRLQYWRKHHNRLSFIFFYMLIIFQHSIRLGACVGRWVVQPRARQKSKEGIIKNVAGLRLLLTLEYQEMRI